MWKTFGSGTQFGGKQVGKIRFLITDNSLSKIPQTLFHPTTTFGG